MGVTSRRNIAFAVVGVVAVAAILIVLSNMGVFGNIEKKPQVKFVSFNREGTIELKQGEQLPIEFNIINNEMVPVSQVSVKTIYDGLQEVFNVDRPDYQVDGTIGANQGQSGQKTVIVTGVTNPQSELVANFKVTLYVGDIDTDSKTFSIRLKK